jgi:hypothetical protein
MGDSNTLAIGNWSSLEGKWWPATTVGFTVAGGLLIIGLHQSLGWAFFVLAVLSALIQTGSARRHFLISQGALLLVMLTPVNTGLDTRHMIIMSLMLPLAVALPAIVSRQVFRDNVIHFPFRLGRRWYRNEIVYIIGTLIAAYILLPIYFTTTGAHHNWTVQLQPGTLLRLFYGTQILGLWDELFFVNTILSLWRPHLPFWWANLAQATLFSAFLYQLAFHAWAPPLLFLFALSQGYIYKRTASLIYIITIHQTLDLVLYLALIHAYYPSAMPVFLT